MLVRSEGVPALQAFVDGWTDEARKWDKEIEGERLKGDGAAC